MDGMTPTSEYGWQVVDLGESVHVVPVHESDHAPDAGCWCAPKVEPAMNDRRLFVVHNEKN